MSDDKGKTRTPKGEKASDKDARRAALAEALRANLHRRKAQARARKDKKTD